MSQAQSNNTLVSTERVSHSA